MAVIDLALARQTDPDSASRARLLALSCVEQVYGLDLDTRLAIAQEAIATARRSEDPIALFDALRYSDAGVAAPQNLDLRLAWNVEACEIAAALGDPARRCQAHQSAWPNAMEAGDAEAMRAHHALANDLAGRVPHASIQWITAFGRVIPPILEGDLEEAERQADAAFALAIETGQPDPMGVYAGNLVNLRFHQGRYGELVELLEGVVAESPRQPVYRATLGSACQYGGWNDRAAALLADERSADFPMALDGAWTTGLCVWADVAVRLGDHAAAQVLRERLAPFHSRMPFTGVSILPAVAHYLGRLDHLLGRHEDADGWFREAMTSHERFRSPLLVAHTQAAWASLLADRDDEARAREMADAALAAAADGGFGYVEADARAVLARLT